MYTNSVKALPVAIARRFDKSTALEIQRQRQVSCGDISMQPKGLGNGKQVLQSRLEQQCRQLVSGRKLLGEGRLG